VEFGGWSVPLPRPVDDARRVIMGIRPQDLLDASQADPALPRIEVTPAVVEDLGSSTNVVFPVDAPAVDVDAVRAASDDRERAVLLADDRRALFTAELGETVPVRVGETLTLALDPQRFHFFAPENGAALPRS
jgi:ABC-type sugar transport system ATPase subunit